MTKALLISGSPREGNTEYILRGVHKMLRDPAELVILRELDVRHCTGCLSCEGTGRCPIGDGMQDLYTRMEEADVLVIGTPNYFDNVPGLVKDFMDRCNTFYNSGRLKGKKAVFIVVGGGSAGDSRRVAEQALRYFANGVGLDVAGTFVFTGTDGKSLSGSPGTAGEVAEISRLISSL